VTLWALRCAGLRTRAATRTLLVFLVVLYSAFLASIVISGALLALGLARTHGPVALGAIAAGASLLGIALALALALRRTPPPEPLGERFAGSRAPRLKAGARLVGEAVREACMLLRSRDPRLAGAVAYWAFDAAVLWTMLRAVGAAPALPVIVLAYFMGQVANTLPIPGSVSGGIAGVLIMFGVPAELALPSVLAYRAVSVWLPAPVAIGAVPALRATITRWRRADAEQLATQPAVA